MTQTATLEVYSGVNWRSVTGRIVKIYPNGSVTIDDARNVRYFANKDRVKIHANNEPTKGKNNLLW